MKKLVLLLAIFLITVGAYSQGFELPAFHENYRGLIGETIRVPLTIKNTTDKSIVVVIRKVSEQIGSTQKNFYCQNGDCLDQRIQEYQVRIEPGETLNNAEIGLEAGLVPGVSSVRYIVFNKAFPSHIFEFDLNFSVEERTDKPKIYNSKVIHVNDVYPNPASDYAMVNYRLLNEKAKATIRIHNILGNVIDEYDLPASENLMRIKTEDLNAGIYFYTLYIDNESVLTRKLIVKK